MLNGTGRWIIPCAALSLDKFKGSPTSRHQGSMWVQGKLTSSFSSLFLFSFLPEALHVLPQVLLSWLYVLSHPLSSVFLELPHVRTQTAKHSTNSPYKNINLCLACKAKQASAWLSTRERVGAEIKWQWMNVIATCGDEPKRFQCSSDSTSAARQLLNKRRHLETLNIHCIVRWNLFLNYYLKCFCES